MENTLLKIALIGLLGYLLLDEPPSEKQSFQEHVDWIDSTNAQTLKIAESIAFDSCQESWRQIEYDKHGLIKKVTYISRR